MVQETHPLLKGNTRLLAQYQWLCFMTIFLVVVVLSFVYAVGFFLPMLMVVGPLGSGPTHRVAANAAKPFFGLPLDAAQPFLQLL